VLNTLYENGYIHPDDVAPTAGYLRASFDAWQATAGPGGAWADLFFPAPLTYPALRPSFAGATIFAPTRQTILLFAAGSGALLEEDAVATPVAERGIGDFVLQPAVIKEVFIDVIVAALGALGLPASVERLRPFAARILFNPRFRPVLRVLQRIVDLFFAGAPMDDIVKNLGTLISLLYSLGVLGELLEELFTDLDFWDVALAVLGLLSLVAGGIGVAARIAYIVGKLASLAFELNRKYRNYLAGRPLFAEDED
jgi:hypothetical protein